MKYELEKASLTSWTTSVGGSNETMVSFAIAFKKMTVTYTAQNEDGTPGADVIFVESPESEAELERIGKEVDKPLLANMVEFGKTPRVEAARLKQWGFDLAIYPGLGFSVAAEAMRMAWAHLKDKGTSTGVNVPQYRNMHELMGFPEVWDFEKRWAQ